MDTKRALVYVEYSDAQEAAANTQQGGRSRMIHVDISDEDMAALRNERYTNPNPRVKRKMEALYLIGLGLPRHEVASIAGITEGTLRNYVHAYQTGGLDALRQFNPHPTYAALDVHFETLKAEFSANPPRTVQEAVERIEALTGICRSPTTVRMWLKKVGVTVAKPGPSRRKRIGSRKDYYWLPR